MNKARKPAPPPIPDEAHRAPFADRPAREGYFPHLMSRLTNRLNLTLLDHLVDYGITIPQWRVLQYLYDRDGATIGDIGADIVMRQPAVSRIVVQLEERDLAARRKNPDNARYVNVFLTARGREIIQIGTPLAVAVSEEALSALDSGERVLLTQYLQRMFHKLNTKNHHGRGRE
jgi:DNA-binding MarR family transcriptional regulator